MVVTPENKQRAGNMTAQTEEILTSPLGLSAHTAARSYDGHSERLQKNMVGNCLMMAFTESGKELLRQERAFSYATQTPGQRRPQPKDSGASQLGCISSENNKYPFVGTPYPPPQWLCTVASPRVLPAPQRVYHFLLFTLLFCGLYLG